MTTTVLRFVGSMGSGKTTALHAFAEERSAAGVKCLFTSGDSSLAGIRQELARAGDYKAVLIDECERPTRSQEDLITGLMGIGLDHIVVACSRHPAEAQLDAALADLTEAAATLRRYEGYHRAKGTDESTAKAEVNAALAACFEATIASVSGPAIAIVEGDENAAAVQAVLGNDLVHAWKTGPASHGRSDIGLLKAITQEDLDKIKSENRGGASKARTLEDLIALGTSRNFANPQAWATKVWENRQRAKANKQPALPATLLQTINAKMHEGQCPTAGSLGECAAILPWAPGYIAMLYIWDKDFNDSTEVAGWFHEAGAEGVTVGHTLFSDNNEDRDGKTVTGCREWAVFFRMAGGAE